MGFSLVMGWIDCWPWVSLFFFFFFFFFLVGGGFFFFFFFLLGNMKFIILVHR